MESASKMGDQTAYSVHGSVRPLYVVGDVPYSEYGEGFQISRDEIARDFDIRKKLPTKLAELAFRICESSGTDAESFSPLNGKLPDALMVAHGTNEPLCELKGFSTLVSERARDVLAPIVSDECLFIPTRVKGLLGQWLIFWVTNIADPIDTEQSAFSHSHWNNFGDAVLRPSILTVRDDPRFGKYLFRLPQWKYAWDRDLCFASFRDVVARHKLRGFRWMQRAGTGRFI